MDHYYLPKDLIDDIENLTGGDYGLFSDKEIPIQDIYKNALIDAKDLLFTYQGIIYKILNNTDKYNIDTTTQKLLNELLNYRLYPKSQELDN